MDENQKDIDFEIFKAKNKFHWIIKTELYLPHTDSRVLKEVEERISRPIKSTLRLKSV